MATFLRTEMTPSHLNLRSAEFLPGHFGLQVTAITAGQLTMNMDIRPFMLAPNGFLHAASIVTLADTACGYATMAHLPEGAENFTTIELKSNFFATQKTGTLTCVATAAHAGRNTQVWDAEVLSDSGKKLALFRCTQMVLWPKAK